MLQKTCYLFGRGNGKIRRFFRDNRIQVAETLPYGYFVTVTGPESIEKFPHRLIRDGWSLPEECVADLLLRRGETCTFVESCTGGMCAVKVTALPGSSDVFWGGWVVYSNSAKIRLGVLNETLTQHGAVSKETVLRLAASGLEHSGSAWCAAISGIAGPAGGSAEKPVGTVWIGLAGGKDAPKGYRFLFSGGRKSVREKASAAAFLLLEQLISND